MPNCTIPDCDAEATVDLDTMPVCATCDYLIDHPEVDNLDDVRFFQALLG